MKSLMASGAAWAGISNLTGAAKAPVANTRKSAKAHVALRLRRGIRVIPYYTIGGRKPLKKSSKRLRTRDEEGAVAVRVNLDMARFADELQETRQVIQRATAAESHRCHFRTHAEPDAVIS